MAGFVKEVVPRMHALSRISESLHWPWLCRTERLDLRAAIGRRAASAIYSDCQYPPYTRSLRDGYAVRSADVVSATAGTPAFLRLAGSVEMGTLPDVTVAAGEAAAIPTGGILPSGADSVVMYENTMRASEWIEIRSGVQSGDNVIGSGEDFSVGDQLLAAGDMIDFRSAALLATVGISEIEAAAPKIRILSTGDEIVPSETEALSPGLIRDANSWSISAILGKYGFESSFAGILNDDEKIFESRVMEELEKCDVLILSGGSSVGVRDRCSEALSHLPAPGLILRGINIQPGKPTLAAGCLVSKKLVVSLPGHPLSCFTVAYTLLLPMLLDMIGAANRSPYNKITLRLVADLPAKSGVEEFVPCRLRNDTAVPITAKSGYISALKSADGMVRIPENMETLRAGDEAEVWLW